MKAPFLGMRADGPPPRLRLFEGRLGLVQPQRSVACRRSAHRAGDVAKINSAIAHGRPGKVESIGAAGKGDEVHLLAGVALNVVADLLALFVVELEAHLRGHLVELGVAFVIAAAVDVEAVEGRALRIEVTEKPGRWVNAGREEVYVRKAAEIARALGIDVAELPGELRQLDAGFEARFRAHARYDIDIT